MSYSFSFYCTCGAGWTGTVATLEVLQRCETIWLRAHNEPGCTLCSAGTARRNRIKSERKQQADGRET